MAATGRLAPHGARPRGAAALALASLVAAAFAFARLSANAAALAVVLGAWWRPLVALVAGSALAAALAARVAWRGELRLAVAARLAFAVLAAGWLAFLAWVQPFQRLWLELALGVAAGACASVWLAAAALAGRAPRALQIAERSLFALALAVVGLELGLRGVARVHTSPYLARSGDGERAVIERFRCEPGLVRFGFPCNSRGFYDDELRRRAPDERLIAAIGDSFLLGAVPHAYHWTTLCERMLGVPVASLGVPGIGPREYVRLALDEALPLDPDLIVASFFVGNDLELGPDPAELTHPWLREVFARDRSLLFTLAARLGRVREERQRADGATARRPGEGTRAAELELERAFPWLADPRRETPTLSEEAFLGLETRRARLACRADPAALARAERALLRLREAAADRELVVVLVPDEFQVDDELWRAVRAEAEVELDRDRPQRELAAICARAGIRVVDLLPALRAAPPLADGRRHVYHLRDTHFNARGNRVAAEAIAPVLAPLLER